MFKLTDNEKAGAFAHCLNLLQQRIEESGNEQRTTGLVILEFKEDGDYNCYQAGSLNKGLTLGALVDTLISWREQSNANQAGQLFEAMLASSNIPDDELN